MTSHLWLTDRSRFVLGKQHCSLARFYEYHSNGYGIRRKAEALPLATGTATHNILAQVMLEIEEVNEKTRPRVRELIQEEQKRYRKICTQRGYLEEGVASDEILQIVEEQEALVEALIWGWCKRVLPWLRAEFRVVAVEQEECLVLDCTCGLGDLIGGKDDHEARDCNGIGTMVRGDMVLERLKDRSVGVHDFKTGSEDSKPWRDQWEVSVQMALQTLAAEKRGEKKVQHFYVHGLFKGQRGQDYNPETGRYDLPGVKRQKTVLLYAYWHPADGLLFKEDDWKPHFKFWSPTGGRKKDGGYTTLKDKGYELRPVWRANFKDKPKDWTAVEWWVETKVPAEDLDKAFQVVGPFPRPDALIERVLPVLAAEEQEVRRVLYALAEVLQQECGGDEAHPTYQRALLELVKPSFNCFKWNRKCQMLPVCSRDPGWEKPWEMQEFTARIPHHVPELEQAKARGVEFPEEAWEEEEEEQ